MDKISIESFEPGEFNLTIPGYSPITLNRTQMEELKKEVDVLLTITSSDLENDHFQISALDE